MNSTASSHNTAAEKSNSDHIQKAEELLTKALDTFKKGKYEAAFDAASHVKAFRLNVKNVDYFRAACLLHLGRPIDAREALREELHFFPTNNNASELLNEVLKANPHRPRVKDAAFNEMYSLIYPHTMIPEERLYNLFTLARKVCKEDIPGNFVECGVSRGGATFLLALTIQEYSTRPRIHFGFDTFEGMPPPTEHDMLNGVFADETGWGSGTCGGNLDEVQRLANQLGLDDVITLIPGYFEHTLGQSVTEVGNIALLHLDADWYASTLSILDNFYDNVIPGGFMQFDDYGHWEGCKKALDDFQLNSNLSFTLHSIPGDKQGTWICKP